MTARSLRVLVLQHLPVEHPGTVGASLREGGCEVVTVELDHGERIGDLEAFGLMVVMGGPMDVWEEDDHPWLRPEKEAIRRWVRELERPFLGICLGHQLLADALGGAVGPMTAPEVGLAPVHITRAGADDPLFAGIPSPVCGLQWHGSEVTRLPEDAVTLAANESCAVQAFRVGERAWGLQFHVEVGRDTVAEWASVPTYREALADAGVDQDGFASAVAERLGPMERLSRTITERFMAAADRAAALDGPRTRR